MFVVGHYQDVRDQCAELSRDELDHVLLGQIMANMNITTIVGPKSKHSPTVRKRPRVTYSHQGQSICKGLLFWYSMELVSLLFLFKKNLN